MSTSFFPDLSLSVAVICQYITTAPSDTLDVAERMLVLFLHDHQNSNGLSWHQYSSIQFLSLHSGHMHPHLNSTEASSIPCSMHNIVLDPAQPCSNSLKCYEYCTHSHSKEAQMAIKYSNSLNEVKSIAELVESIKHSFSIKNFCIALTNILFCWDTIDCSRATHARSLPS